MVTPMPNGATSFPTASAKPSMPHLVAWYIEPPGNAAWPPKVESWMIRPPPWARRYGSAARISWIEPVRLVAMTWSIWSSVSSSAAPNRP